MKPSVLFMFKKRLRDFRLNKLILLIIGALLGFSQTAEAQYGVPQTKYQIKYQVLAKIRAYCNIDLSKARAQLFINGKQAKIFDFDSSGVAISHTNYPRYHPPDSIGISISHPETINTYTFRWKFKNIPNPQPKTYRIPHTTIIRCPEEVTANRDTILERNREAKQDIPEVIPPKDSKDTTVQAANKIPSISAPDARSTSPEKFEVVLYPNPTNGLVHFRFATEKQIPARLYVRDASGSILNQRKIEVKAGEIYSININDFTAGLYFFHFTTGNQVLTQKVIHNK